MSVKLESVSRTSQHNRSPAGSVQSSKALSKVSSIIKMKRAETAAARARLEFAKTKKETEVRKKQDEQEIMAKANTTRLKVELLTNEKVAAAAEAETPALEVSGIGNAGPRSAIGRPPDS